MNVNVDAKDLSSIIKKIPYRAIFIILTLVSGGIIFLPDTVIKKLYLYNFRNTFGFWIGLIFLILFFVSIYLIITPIIKRKIINRTFYGKYAQKKFDLLCDEEKKIIMCMYNESSHTHRLSKSDAIVELLTEKMFVNHTAYGVPIGKDLFFDYYLQPWVIEYLNKHPEFLKSFPKGKSQAYEKWEEYNGYFMPI